MLLVYFEQLPQTLCTTEEECCAGLIKSGCMYCNAILLMRHYFPKLTYLHFPIRVKYVFSYIVKMHDFRWMWITFIFIIFSIESVMM